MAYTLRLEITEQTVNRIIDTLERVRQEVMDGRLAGQAQFNQPANDDEPAEFGSYTWSISTDE